MTTQIPFYEYISNFSYWLIKIYSSERPVAEATFTAIWTLKYKLFRMPLPLSPSLTPNPPPYQIIKIERAAAPGYRPNLVNAMKVGFTEN